MHQSSIIGPQPVTSRYECLDCGKRFTAISFVGGSSMPPFLRIPMPLARCTESGSIHVRELGILDTLSDISDWFSEL